MLDSTYNRWHRRRLSCRRRTHPSYVPSLYARTPLSNCPKETMRGVASLRSMITPITWMTQTTTMEIL